MSWLRRVGLHLGLFALASGFALILWVVVADWLILPGFVRRGQVREVPDVTERPLEEARRILERGGFKLVLDEEREDADVPAGSIVSQLPPAFSTVKKGRRIYVVVSKGAQRCLVPNVMESSRRQAEVKLRQSGLILGTEGTVESDLVPKGVVLGQDPSPGTEVSRGSAVNITLSLGAGGPNQVVPDLVGEFLDDAQQILKKRGLRVGRVQYELSMIHLPDTVLSQMPEAGQIVEKGHKIDLVVASL